MVFLSVIIPAYNEEKRLPRTVRAVHEYLVRQNYSYEIIVSDGGSTDGTRELVVSLGKEIPGLSLLKVENKGKGYAVRTAMLKAQGEFRVFMDADNATTIDHVERMFPKFKEGCSVVICSRDMKGAVLAVAQPWWRRLLGDIFNLKVQVVSGLWGYWDTQCGFKGFTARAAEDIFSRAVIDTWAFDVELLVIAKKKGFRVAEVPATWMNDPDSKVKFSGMIAMFFEILRIRMNIWKGVYEK
ncbi:MAG: glycosyltransferase family 2 protein [Candidatus Wildermuthbacteria bacterium]|nr:glycosyltransferase family 2 protein [Candidatus Wildermuthbacteria bacterium]